MEDAGRGWGQQGGSAVELPEQRERVDLRILLAELNHISNVVLILAASSTEKIQT